MMEFFKEHLIYLITLFSVLSFLKFLISGYWNHRNIKLNNKDIYKVNKCLTDISVEVHSSDLKISELVMSLNNKKLADQYSEYYDSKNKAS